eukprot:jgi/Mesvir1/13579/Mv02996-RA.1
MPVCMLTSVPVAYPPGYSPMSDSVALPENFCIIEGRETVQNFAQLALKDIDAGITARRNKIFLLLEEVRRLRIQRQLKSFEAEQETGDEPNPMEAFDSYIPFLPQLNEKSLPEYYRFFALTVSGIIFFGGFIAPMLEVKLGFGNQSYAEFIHQLGLPSQLSQVDPIVASFVGGTVGVISALLVIEINNVKRQLKKICHYCEGAGYLECATCTGTGAIEAEGSGELVTAGVVGMEINGNGKPGGRKLKPTRMGPWTRCSPCSGSGKVMCPTCLCTGRFLATEHDPRIDPFE